MANLAETPDEDVSMFEVLSDRYEWVNVRAGPAMNAAKLGQKRRGRKETLGANHQHTRNTTRLLDSLLKEQSTL